MLAGNPGRENMCGGYLGVVGRQRVSSVVAHGRKFPVFLSVSADGAQRGSCCLLQPCTQAKTCCLCTHPFSAWGKVPQAKSERHWYPSFDRFIGFGWETVCPNL